MKNKSLISLLFILSLFWGEVAKSQTSLTGIVTTNANCNSIIRAWNDSLVVYAE